MHHFVLVLGLIAPFTALCARGERPGRVETLSANSLVVDDEAGQLVEVGKANETRTTAQKCTSDAQRLYQQAMQAFNSIKESQNVDVTAAGVVTLPKLQNQFPYQGCPAGKLETEGPKDCIAKAQEKIAKGQNGPGPFTINLEGDALAAVNDMNTLFTCVGLKKISVVGSAAGTHADKCSTKAIGDEWVKLAKLRAEDLLSKLTSTTRSTAIQKSGKCGREIGVQITIETFLKLSALKAVGAQAALADCDPSGWGALTFDILKSRVKEVTDRGNVGLGADGTVSLKQIPDNVVPFTSCVPPKNAKLAALLPLIATCVDSAALKDEDGLTEKVTRAMNDIAELGMILGATELDIVGHVPTSGTTGDDREKHALTQLAAARAGVLSKILHQQASVAGCRYVRLRTGSRGGCLSMEFPVEIAARKLKDQAAACVATTNLAGARQKCSKVSLLDAGDIAVKIQMTTLMNLNALLR